MVPASSARWEGGIWTLLRTQELLGILLGVGIGVLVSQAEGRPLEAAQQVICSDENPRVSGRGRRAVQEGEVEQPSKSGDDALDAQRGGLLGSQERGVCVG